VVRLAFSSGRFPESEFESSLTELLRSAFLEDSEKELVSISIERIRLRGLLCNLSKAVIAFMRLIE